MRQNGTIAAINSLHATYTEAHHDGHDLAAAWAAARLALGHVRHAVRLRRRRPAEPHAPAALVDSVLEAASLEELDAGIRSLEHLSSIPAARQRLADLFEHSRDRLADLRACACAMGSPDLEFLIDKAIERLGHFEAKTLARAATEPDAA